MTRAPSQKRLEEAFPGKGKELRELLKGERKTRSYKSVQELDRQCFYPPDYPHRLMTALNEITEGCGVETIYKNGKSVAEYINHGDPYVTTLLRIEETGTILITCWGDFVESNRL
jgi:hypothetical protein